jgi:short-subunit dehydrogenase
VNKYLKQYEWSNIFAFLANEKKDPAICKDDFKGRLVVISGATSGIGKATVEKYASHGADILCINRNESKSIQLCQSLEDQYGIEANFILADFTHLDEVHTAAKHLANLDRDIDILIHNAGIYLTKKRLTADHNEVMFQIIYLSSLIINFYLKEKFLKQNSGRIIFVNSEGHRFAILGLQLDDLNWEKRRYSGSKSYGSAKTAQLLSMLVFDDFYSGSGVTINAMHPGNVKSNMGGENGGFYKLTKNLIVDRTAKSPEISAEALYFLGVDRSLDDVSGKFFNLTTQEIPAPPALDKDEAENLWNVSLALGGLRS